MWERLRLSQKQSSASGPIPEFVYTEEELEFSLNKDLAPLYVCAPFLTSYSSVCSRHSPQYPLRFVQCYLPLGCSQAAEFP